MPEPTTKESLLPKSMRWIPRIGSIVAITLIAASPARACWEQAAERYGVSSELLYAIARTESGLDPQAIGRNRNGSRDIGLMQINSAWLPRLSTHGIAERDLFDPCTSIHVGAWILAGRGALGDVEALDCGIRSCRRWHRDHIEAGVGGPGEAGGRFGIP